MVKQLFSLFIFCCAISTSFAQNLVPNPSFEDYSSDCPVNFHELPSFWEAWRESPNSFSSCGIPTNLIDSLGWVPRNGFGFQEAYSGDSYCGFLACPSPSQVTENNFREYLGCELEEQLVIGESYHLSFVVSLGLSGFYYNTTYASNRIGANLGFQGYEWLDNPMQIPNYAQVFTNEVITDSINWVEISGDFIADQAYTHLALGVFFDFDSLEIMQMSSDVSSLGSYYFVDAVCLRKSDGDCGLFQSVEQQKNEFQFYPNPVSSEFKLKSSQSGEFRLFNSKGKECLSGLVSNNELLQVDVNHLASGIYYLIIQAESKIRREKLVIARE